MSNSQALLKSLSTEEDKLTSEFKSLNHNSLKHLKSLLVKSEITTVSLTSKPEEISLNNLKKIHGSNWEESTPNFSKNQKEFLFKEEILFKIKIKNSKFTEMLISQLSISKTLKPSKSIKLFLENQNNQPPLKLSELNTTKTKESPLVKSEMKLVSSTSNSEETKPKSWKKMPQYNSSTFNYKNIKLPNVSPQTKDSELSLKPKKKLTMLKPTTTDQNKKTCNT